jgi:hypothetical protein
MKRFAIALTALTIASVAIAPATLVELGGNKATI